MTAGLSLNIMLPTLLPRLVSIVVNATNSNVLSGRMLAIVGRRPGAFPLLSELSALRYSIVKSTNDRPSLFSWSLAISPTTATAIPVADDLVCK